MSERDDLLDDIERFMSTQPPTPADLDLLAQMIKADASKLQLSAATRSILMRIAGTALHALRHQEKLNSPRCFRRDDGGLIPVRATVPLS